MATAGLYDITIEQGATWRLELVWKDAEEVPIDLTSYTARMQIREYYGANSAWVSLTSGNGITLGGAAGTITLLMTATQTAALPVRNNVTAVWDIELVNSDGTVVRLLEGSANIRPEVTR